MVKTEPIRASIYDLILSSKATELEEKAPKIKEVNGKTFFSSNDNNGFISKNQFLDHVRSLSKTDLQYFDHLLKMMSEKQKFEVSPFEKLDSKGRPYIWISQNKKNTQSGFKVLTAGNMWQLVNLYGFNLVDCALTLEALYTEAVS